MRWTVSTLVLFLSLVLLSGSDVCAQELSSQTYVGTYKWNNSKPQALTMRVLKKTDAGVYTVEYDLIWKGRKQTYPGSLTVPAQGLISGDAYNENKKRHWTVEYTLSNGTITGKHWEMKKNGDGDMTKKPTGILTLKAQ